MTPQSNRAQRRDPARRPEPTRAPVAKFVKSPDSRILHVDGVYGGLTSRGLVYMAMFVEHNELPAEQHFTVDETTRTIRATDRNKNPAWIREIQTEVILSIEVAQSLRDWLTDKIETRQKLDASSAETYQVIESGPDLATGSGE